MNFILTQFSIVDEKNHACFVDYFYPIAPTVTIEGIPASYKEHADGTIDVYLHEEAENDLLKYTALAEVTSPLTPHETKGVHHGTTKRMTKENLLPYDSIASERVAAVK